MHRVKVWNIHLLQLHIQLLHLISTHHWHQLLSPGQVRVKIGTDIHLYHHWDVA